MPYTDEGKQVMLGALRFAVSHVGAHSDVPSSAINTEPVAGVYRRAEINLFDPVLGVVEAYKIHINVPPNTRVSHIGFWTRAVGGNCLAYYCLEEILYYRGRGVVSVDVAHMDLNLGAVDAQRST
jgi:hypothetical protein